MVQQQWWPHAETNTGQAPMAPPLGQKWMFVDEAVMLVGLGVRAIKLIKHYAVEMAN